MRTFQASGTPRRSAVQTVEVSKSEAKAKAAFRTTVGWYAGCRVGRLQVLNAYRVDNIGDEAQAYYLTEMLAGMKSRPWMKKFFWYQLWEGPTDRSGLLYQNETPKPAWYFYRDYIAAHPAPETIDQYRFTVHEPVPIASVPANLECGPVTTQDGVQISSSRNRDGNV